MSRGSDTAKQRSYRATPRPTAAKETKIESMIYFAETLATSPGTIGQQYYLRRAAYRWAHSLQSPSFHMSFPPERLVPND
jgi:hypothetical protein